MKQHGSILHRHTSAWKILKKRYPLEFVLATNRHDAAAILCADLYMETEYEKALTLYHSALEFAQPRCLSETSQWICHGE